MSLFLILITGVCNSQPIDFLVFGDMPYTHVDEAMLQAPNGKIYKAAQATKGTQAAKAA